jgi:hypothetical protein
MPQGHISLSKPTEASTVRPCSLSTSSEHKFIGDCSAHGVPAAARDPATLAIPRPIRPSIEPLRTSVKLPEPGIELYLAGDTGSTSPDFTRSPAYVDRAPRWVFLRFLARVVSLAPREARSALGLNSTAVSRPEHTPPTSLPACARGPTDSGHHRRRVVPRRDRKDFPELTHPFAEPPSPPCLLPRLLFKRGEGPQGERRRSQGFFEWSETQVNSCAGA